MNDQQEPTTPVPPRADLVLGSEYTRLIRVMVLSLLLGVPFIVLLLWLTQSWAAWQILILGVGSLVLLVYMILRSKPQWFGPMLVYDLVRTARQGRHVWLRCIYAFILLVVFYLLYTSWFTDRGYDIEDIFESGSMPIGDVARFAESFFFAFLGVQFVTVLLVTPVYTAGAIAEEKERRTLEYLLATDLHSREIILGKLFSRLASMTLLVVTGLPILSLAEFLGGVEPNLVIAGFVGTVLTVLSLGSLSILVSVHYARTLDAVVWTYVWAAGFLCLCWCIPPICWGNPGYVVYTIERNWQLGGSGSDALRDLVGGYAAIHILLAVVLCWWAIRRLRLKALPPPALPSVRRPGVEFPPRKPRPRIGDHAMLWKEVHVEPPLGSARLSAYMEYVQLVGGWSLVFVFASFILVWGMTGNRYGGISIRELSDQSNGFVRWIGTFLASGMLLAIALAAAGKISREKERQTLDSLLCTPLEVEQILVAKWLGALLSVRSIAWCLLVVWGVGLVSGGLHILVFPLLLAAFLAQAAFLGGLGLWFSLTNRTTLRATLFTLGGILVMSLGPLLLSELAQVFLSRWISRDIGEEVGRFFQVGLTPYLSLYVLATNLGGDEASSVENLYAAAAGLACYVGAAAVLWVMLRFRFQREAGRLPVPPRQPRNLT